VGSSTIVSIFKKCHGASRRRPTHSTRHTPRHAHPTRSKTHTRTSSKTHTPSLALRRTPAAKTTPRNRIHPHRRCPLPTSANGSAKGRRTCFTLPRIVTSRRVHVARSFAECSSLTRNIEEVVAHSWVEGIEVCHSMEELKHVHSHAVAQAQAQLGLGLGGRDF